MQPPKPKGILARLRAKKAEWQNKQRIHRLASQVLAHAHPEQNRKPVVVFNVSSRLTGLSQNASFTLLTTWGLRLMGAPVIHFVCQAGMSHCVLGTNRQDYTSPPPCDACIAQSHRLYHGAEVSWFKYQQDTLLSKELENQSISRLVDYEIPPADLRFLNLKHQEPLPLGHLVLPSIRWALRCHHLPDDEPTRYLMQQYMLSAYFIAKSFADLLDQANPDVAMIFNGIMYPEAAARWVAIKRDVCVVTHEVGFQPFSTFFTSGDATAYPIHIPDDFALSPAQNERLDTYLEQRFKGKFTMAGIRFWPEMTGLDERFLQRAAQFRQVIPVFTNVIFDTSQIHANTIFAHMFDWLDAVLKVIRHHPDTLFVIRAHPDEMRPGTAKQSRESVRNWVFTNQVGSLPNVNFIDSQEYISSYELMQRSKFLMVYNSSIGLEAALLGVPVLCGGKARYTQYPTVFLPASVDEFHQMAKKLLRAEKIDLPPEFQRNARRFLYYQLYRASIPFGEFLQTGPRPGFVQVRPFSWKQLLPENSPGIKTVVNGILDGKSFLFDEAHE